VLVAGKLRIRDWENGEKSGTTVDIEADAVGHDLAWGSTVFTRTVVTTPVSAPVHEEAPADPETTADHVTPPVAPELAPTPF